MVEDNEKKWEWNHWVGKELCLFRMGIMVEAYLKRGMWGMMNKKRKSYNIFCVVSDEEEVSWKGKSWWSQGFNIKNDKGFYWCKRKIPIGNNELFMKLEPIKTHIFLNNGEIY